MRGRPAAPRLTATSAAALARLTPESTRLTSRTYSSGSVGGAGDDRRQAAQHVDVSVGVAELNLLQIARAERLFLCGLRHVERDVHPFVGQRERGLADDEMLARLELETGGRLATDKDRIAGRGQPIDSQPRAVPDRSGHDRG